jgi:hypothetical protein
MAGQETGMKRAAQVAMLFLVVGSLVAEDRVFLKDGQVISGNLLSMNRDDVQIRTDEETLRVPRLAIDKIERDGLGEVQTIVPEAEGKPVPPGAGRQDQSPSEELTAWVEICVTHLESEDPRVRSGAELALGLAGPAARKSLEQILAEKGDDAPAGVKRQLNRLLRSEYASRERMRAPRRDRVEQMAESLELSEEQVAKLTDVFNDYAERRMELARAARVGEIESDAAGAQFESLRESFESDLAVILTEEQLARYRELNP